MHPHEPQSSTAPFLSPTLSTLMSGEAEGGGAHGAWEHNVGFVVFQGRLLVVLPSAVKGIEREGT